MDLRPAILTYLADHPASRPGQIAAAIGSSSGRVAATLRGLAHAGAVQSRRVNGADAWSLATRPEPAPEPAPAAAAHAPMPRVGEPFPRLALSCPHPRDARDPGRWCYYYADRPSVPRPTCTGDEDRLPCGDLAVCHPAARPVQGPTP